MRTPALESIDNSRQQRKSLSQTGLAEYLSPQTVRTVGRSTPKTCWGVGGSAFVSSSSVILSLYLGITILESCIHLSG